MIRSNGRNSRRMRLLARVASAFTFVEVMVVVIIIGVLAAIVIPQFGGVTEDAKASACEGGLAGVRSAIAGYRAKAILTGSAAYPSLTQLNTQGVVVEGELPKNPFNGLREVQLVSVGAANSRSVSNTSTYGWNYYVDNTATPPKAVFYANSSQVTTVPDGDGRFKTANEL